MTYLNPSKIWAPQHPEAQYEQSLLAILVPAKMQTIQTEGQYLELLVKRVAWLIHSWLDEAPTDLNETQQMLRRKQHQLNPDLWSTPNAPESEAAEDLMNWQFAWADVLVKDCGAVQTLLTRTATEFPQRVNLSESKQEELRMLFLPPVSDGCCLEEWLNSLLYTQTHA